MVAKARGARSQRRDDDGAAGICLPPITAYGLSSEAIEAVERAPPPKPRRQPLHASASEPSLASEWVSDSALAADVGLGLVQMKQQMEREARRQRALEQALIERPLAQSLKRSAKSYTRLKSVMSTKLQPLKKEHLQRGERSFLMRSTTQRSRDLANLAAGDTKDKEASALRWRPVNAPVLHQIINPNRIDTSAAELLALSPPDNLRAVRPRDAPKLSMIQIDARRQAQLMMGGRTADSMTEEQAYMILARESLRQQRRRQASAFDMGEEDEGADEDVNEVLDLLGGRGTTGLRKVIDVFRELDSDGDGEVTKADFHNRLLELGVDYYESADVDRIFDEVDQDGDGRLTYDELKTVLRRNKQVRLTRVLRDGAVEFMVEPKNAHALRKDINERRFDEAELREVSLDEMRLALLEGAGKVLDLLHRLDTNGDRTVSKSEFRHSLPLMGFDASQTEVIDAVFDELDEDGSGTIEFEELEAKLRQGLSVELKAELQAGAVDEADWRYAKSRYALRTDINERKAETLLELTSIEDLREAIRSGAGKIIDMLRTLDRNNDHTVSKSEFREALPLLGYDSSNEAVIDEIFDELDEDGSGSIDYEELSTKLRQGNAFELAKSLQDGAVAFDTEAKNKHSLREHIDERREGAGPLKLLSVEELRLGLLNGMGRISDLLRRFDRNRDGKVSKAEFRVVLPLLGYDASNSEAIDTIFDELDGDGSGDLDQSELSDKLRQGLSVELAAELQAGALGEIDAHAHNRHSLRSSVDERRGALRVLSSTDELRAAMIEGAARITDLFRALDRNGDKTVSKEELAEALPLMGYEMSDTGVINEIFDDLDEDGSGTIEYEELEAKLRRQVTLRAELREGALGDVDEWGRTPLAGDDDDGEVRRRAATRVQAGIRGRQARTHIAFGRGQQNPSPKDVGRLAESDAAAAAGEDERIAAATKVQAGVRGRQARANLNVQAASADAGAVAEGEGEGTRESAAEPEPTAEEIAAADEAAAAATRVQASIRGRQARMQARAMAETPGNEATREGAADVTEAELAAEAKAADEAAEAAIRVQASIRGRQSRAKMKKVEQEQ